MIYISNHLKTPTHIFKWVKICNICLIWDQTFLLNLDHFDVQTHIFQQITVIWSANKMDWKRA